MLNIAERVFEGIISGEIDSPESVYHGQTVKIVRAVTNHSQKWFEVIFDSGYEVGKNTHVWFKESEIIIQRGMND